MMQSEANALSASRRVLMLVALLSTGALAAAAQMTMIPSMTGMAAEFADWGDGVLIAQIVTTTAFVTMTVGAPLMGWVASRLDNRTVFFASAFVYAVAGSVGALKIDLPVLLVTRLAVGLSSVGLSTTSIAIVRLNWTGERRDRLIGLGSTFGGGGGLVSLIAAGQLAESGGWRMPFLLFLVALPISAIAYFAFPKEVPCSVDTEGALRDSMARVYPIAAAGLAVCIASTMPALQGAFLLATNGLTSPTVQSTVLLMTTVGSMGGAYGFGMLSARARFTTLLAGGFAIAGLGDLGFAFGKDPAIAGLFAGIVGISVGFTIVAITSALRVVSPDASSKAAGIVIGGVYLGQILNPLVVSPIRGEWGLQGAFITIGSLALAAAFMSGALGVVRARRAQIACAGAIGS